MATPPKIGITLEAGNAVDTALFTMPASYEGFISNITAYNSTGGSLTLTISITRQNGTEYVLLVDSIATVATSSYSGGSTKRITPLVMLAGEVIQAKGSAAGIFVTISGLRNSV